MKGGDRKEEKILAMKQPQGRPDWHRSWDGQANPAQVGVLIDGDGIPHKYADAILSEAVTLGPLLVPRVFGNWDLPSLRGWQRLLLPYRLERRHHHQVAPGKNATDIALVVDLLELVYQYGVRSFCLAVADSDYTPLISHVQGLGCRVLCLGMAKTVPALKETCHRFVALDQSEVPHALMIGQMETNPPVSSLEEELSLEMKVVLAYDHLANGEKVWIPLPDLEQHLKKLYPLFSPKEYGHRNMTRLVKARFSALFEVRPQLLQQNIHELRRKEEREERRKPRFFSASQKDQEESVSPSDA